MGKLLDADIKKGKLLDADIGKGIYSMRTSGREITRCGHRKGKMLDEDIGGLATEVVEADILVFYTERVEQVEYRLGHHWRTAEVVLAIFGSLMLL